MFQHVLSRLPTVQRYVKHAPFLRSVTSASVPVRSLTEGKDDAQQQQPFDTSLLHFLVCPLSKKPLRYEAKTNELINEELGIAYPIVDGIPNMIPQDARLLQRDPQDRTQE